MTLIEVTKDARRMVEVMTDGGRRKKWDVTTGIIAQEFEHRGLKLPLEDGAEPAGNGRD